MRDNLPDVRIARPADADAVMAMCRNLHRENGLFSLNEEKVRALLQRCFDAKGVIIGLIGPEGGPLVGSICLSISDFYYTDDWHLAELWNYVEPEYRRIHNAEALIEFGKACSDKMQIPFFTGIITNRQMAGKVRLYRRMLGYPTGAFFLYNGNWRSEPLVDHSELRDRLKEFAIMCNDNRVTPTIARKEVGPLLRRANDALADEDNIWGAPKHKNGSAVGAHTDVQGQ